MFVPWQQLLDEKIRARYIQGEFDHGINFSLLAEVVNDGTDMHSFVIAPILALSRSVPLVAVRAEIGDIF